MSQVQEASELVRLVAASDARVTLLFGNFSDVYKTSRPVGLSRSDSSTPALQTVLVPLVERVALTRRAAATRQSEELRPGVADSSDTRVEESLRQSPTHPIL
jgi:hypothetical protein